MILTTNEIAYLGEGYWGSKGDITTPIGTYSHWEVSVAVAIGESGGNTLAIGRSTTGVNKGNRDHGLYQISNRWHQLKGDGTPGRLLLAAADWRLPAVNTRMAYEIWDAERKAGKDPWAPWHVYTSGSYTEYLPDARIACKAPWEPPVEYSYKEDWHLIVERDFSAMQALVVKPLSVALTGTAAIKP